LVREEEGASRAEAKEGEGSASLPREEEEERASLPEGKEEGRRSLLLWSFQKEGKKKDMESEGGEKTFRLDLKGAGAARLRVASSSAWRSSRNHSPMKCSR